MFTLRTSPLPGCVEIQSRVFEDNRGRFVKVFHAPLFKQLGLVSNFTESYYSVSHQGVIRGLHFQTPPQAHVKLVTCLQGSVLDIVVDLRVGSPSYGQYALFDLDEHTASSVYIPAGMAHGFYTNSQTALLSYQVTTPYSPEHDNGILWSSAGIPWPAGHPPILSERDQQFISLAEFVSPFRYEA